MGKYIVTITETNTYQVEVIASSEKEANDKVREFWQPALEANSSKMKSCDLDFYSSLQIKPHNDTKTH